MVVSSGGGSALSSKATEQTEYICATLDTNVRTVWYSFPPWSRARLRDTGKYYQYNPGLEYRERCGISINTKPFLHFHPEVVY